MLNADDLVDSVAEARHLLTALVQRILRKAVLHHRVEVELPSVLLAKRFNDVELLFRPVALSLLFFLLLLLLGQIFVVKVVEGDLPNAGEEDAGAVADLGHAAREVTPLLAGLQRLINRYYLVKALPEMAGPHLVVNVLVPDARVNYGLALHAAAHLVEDVALAGVLRQVFPELVL